MKKQILMTAAFIPVLLFSCINTDNTDKIQSPGIVAEKETRTIPRVSHELLVSEYIQSLSTSSDNRWKTFLLPD